MTKSTISAACASILIIIDENKKLLAIAEKLDNSDYLDFSALVCEWTLTCHIKMGELTDFLNKKSLTVA